MDWSHTAIFFLRRPIAVKEENTLAGVRGRRLSTKCGMFTHLGTRSMWLTILTSPQPQESSRAIADKLDRETFPVLMLGQNSKTCSFVVLWWGSWHTGETVQVQTKISSCTAVWSLSEWAISFRLCTNEFCTYIHSPLIEMCYFTVV